MEKDYQATDYAAILADLEAKRTALDTAIAGVRAAMAAGALGVAVSESMQLKEGPGVGSGHVTLPRGAFLGKTGPEAITLYLSTVRKKQTNREISQALKDGGFEATGDLHSLVTGALFRLKENKSVLRFDDGWGLAEWYPESFRSRIAEKTEAPKKTKKKIARRKEAPSNPIPEPGGLEQRIEAILRSDPIRPFKAREIAEALGVMPQAVSLSLGRLAAKHKAEKSDGGYRFCGAKIQEMPKTG